MARLEVPDRVFITPNTLRKRYGDFDPNVFTRWQRQGKVEKIRNGLYLNGGHRLRSVVDLYSIANRMYVPSYVSTISALRYYNLIPEIVYGVTSISTKKTKEFNFKQTLFSYQQVKSSLFFGFQAIQWRKSSFYIATPEKALLDLAYLEPLFSEAAWLEEMRFDEEELRDGIDWNLMMVYANRIESETVNQRIALLLNTYDL